MFFADIHIHALAGVDDGPSDEEEMFAMLDEAYDQGVRAICFTQHWYPVSFGNNSEKALAAFDLVKSYILAKKVKMYLFLGNELRYSNGAADWLRDGSCRRLKRTRFVLVDFSSGERCEDMIDGVRNILNIDHKPVFAHIERYPDIGKDLKAIEALRSSGIKIQLDAGSVLGRFGLACKNRSLKLLSEGLADIIASDAHGIEHRPILMKEASELVSRSCN